MAIQPNRQICILNTIFLKEILSPYCLTFTVTLQFYFTIDLLNVLPFVELVGVHELNVILL